MGVTKIYLVAAFVRIILILYGNLQDLYFKVKYTDIDYIVFSDAARYVVNGSSPYSRATYRYTPLLAFMMTPNILIHSSFGKVFFSLCDLCDGWLITDIIRHAYANYSPCNSDMVMQSVTVQKSTTIALAVWLFNPLSLTISTRGNAESFQAVLVLASLLFVMNGNHFLGGLFFGLAVHFKIYPVIYSIPILLYISKNVHRKFNKGLKVSDLLQILVLFVKEIFVFVFATGLVLLTTTMVFFRWYQMEFISNTYLYHLGRTDIKHNFSPYFYVLYLTSNSNWSHLIGFLAFLPQALCVSILGLKYHSVLPVAYFLQTFAFVAFNKVCTSQYFIWYLSLLPTAAIYFKTQIFQEIPFIVFLWMSAQGIWLFLAYLLEFQGWNSFLFVWLSSLWFLIVNVYALIRFLCSLSSSGTKNETSLDQKKLC